MIENFLQFNADQQYTVETFDTRIPEEMTKVNKNCDIVDFSKPYNLRNNIDKARMEIWQEGRCICFAAHEALKGSRPPQLIDSRAYDVLETHYRDTYGAINRVLSEALAKARK